MLRFLAPLTQESHGLTNISLLHHASSTFGLCYQVSRLPINNHLSDEVIIRKPSSAVCGAVEQFAVLDEAGAFSLTLLAFQFLCGKAFPLVLHLGREILPGLYLGARVTGDHSVGYVPLHFLLALETAEILSFLDCHFPQILVFDSSRES